MNVFFWIQCSRRGGEITSSDVNMGESYNKRFLDADSSTIYLMTNFRLENRK